MREPGRQAVAAYFVCGHECRLRRPLRMSLMELWERAVNEVVTAVFSKERDDDALFHLRFCAARTARP